MSSKVNICLVGASGRMGQEILASVRRSRERGESIEVAYGVVAAEDPLVGQKVPDILSPLVSEVEPGCGGANVVLDFSSPQGTLIALEAAYQNRLPLLVGTTGLPAEYGPIFEKTASVVPLVRTTNTSVGVNTMLQLVYQAAQMLDPQTDIEIVETHHRAKKDAPSGTALSLARAAAEAREAVFAQVLETGRTGMTGERKRGAIGVQAVRGGDVPGDHTVLFLGDGERLEITHRVGKRAIFADGAVRAAVWLAGRGQQSGSAGMFTMADVLGGR